MIANQFLGQPARNLDFSFGVNKTQHSILQYLREWLPLFLKEIGGHFPSNAKEDDISGVLALFLQKRMKATNLLIDLNRKWGSDFQFTTDVLMGSNPIFLMEAKRLPSTSTRDYVHHSKKPGGISRFKLEQSGFGKHLASSAMLGYVQKYDFDYFLNQVNTWISDLIESDESSEMNWVNADMLVETARSHSIRSLIIRAAFS